MNDAFWYASAALGGSAVGALSSLGTTWLSTKAQERARRVLQAAERNEKLYGEFIEEASKLLSDALTHKFDDVSKLVHLYAVMSKMRLFASEPVLSAADEVMRRIFEFYENPDKDFHAVITAASEYDLLRAFSEVCRREIEGRSDNRHSEVAR